MIEIEKNIPVPPINAGRNRSYPFANMEVGDSFFIPKSDTGNGYNGVYSSARYYKVRVAVRAEQHNGISGFRVWRIE